MMTVTTKVVRDGKVIDTPSWKVIRRYYQFKMFHSKVCRIMKMIIFIDILYITIFLLVEEYESTKST